MTRLSNFFLYSGAAIAMLGVAGYVAGAWFNLPPEAVRAIAAQRGLILPASGASITSRTTGSRQSATERAT